MKGASDRADERVLTDPKELPPGLRWRIECDDEHGWEAILGPRAERAGTIAGAFVFVGGWNAIALYGVVLLAKERHPSLLGLGLLFSVVLCGFSVTYYVIASLLSRTHFKIDGATVSIRSRPFLPSGTRILRVHGEIARFESATAEVATSEDGDRIYHRLVLVPKTGANIVVRALDSKEAVEFVAASLNEALEQFRPAPDPLETRGPFR